MDVRVQPMPPTSSRSSGIPMGHPPPNQPSSQSQNGPSRIDYVNSAFVANGGMEQSAHAMMAFGSSGDRRVGLGGPPLSTRLPMMPAPPFPAPGIRSGIPTAPPPNQAHISSTGEF